MLIEKVRLHPFAGLVNKEIVFEEGLNVICGANEAGKSTLVNALLFVFFTPTNLTPAKQQNILQPFLPVNGGDTIAIDVYFSVNNKAYRLKKKWGGTNSCSLIKPDGSETTAARSVQEELDVLLKNNEATFRNILFASQAMLASTIDCISRDANIATSFSDIIQGSLLTGEGISSEKMKLELNQRIAELDNSWDWPSQRPLISAGGLGGLDNRRAKNVGLILASYYQKADAERDLLQRKIYDEVLEKLVSEIERMTHQVADSLGFVEANQGIVEDVRNRRTIEAELKSTLLLSDRLNTDSENWNRAEIGKEMLSGNIRPLHDAIDSLEKELEITLRKQKGAAKQALLSQIKKAKNELDNFVTKNESVTSISNEDLIEAEGLSSTITKINIQMEAQKLRVLLSAHVDFNAEVTSGLKTAETVNLFKGDNIEMEVNGQFILKSNELKVQVQSGQEDVNDLRAKHDDTLSEINNILSRNDAGNFDELKMLHKKFATYQSEQMHLEKTLQGVISETNVEQLEKDVAEIDNLPSSRDERQLREELSNKRIEMSRLKDTIENLERSKKSLVTTYETKAALEGKKLAALLGQQKLDKSLADLKPLPPGVMDSETFIREFEQKQLLWQNSKDSLNALLVKKSEHERDEPSFTADEINENIITTTNNFNEFISRSNACKKVREKLDDILARIAATPYDEYHKKMQFYFSCLTGSKYTGVQMDKLIPANISNASSSLPAKLLSKGTKDSLSLALRLSMSDYFLKDDNGFIVMDDPLTDLDPKRQKLAADSIENYAKEKQVLLFTCHPGHVELFAGNVIDLASISKSELVV